MRIVVFKEEGFPSRGISGDVAAWLSRLDGVDVQLRDVAAILKDGVDGDAFCNVHGEIYPVVLEERLFEFFQRSGGLLHLGGLPFETAMQQTDGNWGEVVRTYGDLHRGPVPGAVKAPIDFFRARLGMMAYAPPYPLDQAAGLTQTYDAGLVGIPPHADNLPRQGLTICTTMPLHLPRPDLYGDDRRVYHVKPMIRETHIVGSLVAPDGATVLASLLFCKSWGNPYGVDQSKPVRPWAVYTGHLGAEPPTGLLPAMLRWVTSPVCLRPIDLESATIHAGETVSVQVRLEGTLPPGWRLAAYHAAQTKDEFLAGMPILWNECPVDLKGSIATLQVGDREEAFLLPVRFAILDEQGSQRDVSDSAVVPWRPVALAEAPRLSSNGRYFNITKGDKHLSSQWIQGTNWQDRSQYAFTWHNPNPLRLACDARGMADAGILLARCHYFMPQWIKHSGLNFFGDVCPELYADFEDGPELSEQHLRALEAHLMVFGRLGVVLMPTVYTNPGPNMGDPAHWMTQSRLVLPGLLGNQKRFARQVMSRLGAVPNVTWDLCNEADMNMDRFGEWLQELKPIWGATGQMVGIGTFHLNQNLLLGEGADWHSIHIPCCKVADTYYSGKPCLLQEAWVPTPATAVGEEDVEFYLHRAIPWTLTFGGAGFMPWNWNMFLTDWRYGSGFVEYWDNELGCAVHPDNTPRRGRIAMRNWAIFLEGLSFDQTADRQVLFVYPKTGQNGIGITEYLDLLHAEGIPSGAINDADVAAADLSHTKFVVLPYFAKGYRQSTWDRLRRFAAEGGVVWAHTDVILLDENGELAPARTIPVREGKEPVGLGIFAWGYGWSTATPNPITLYKQLLKELPLARRPKLSLPLVDGELRYTERMSTDEKTMKTDWVPLDKLPDRMVVTSVAVVDKAGGLCRAWSGEGAPVQIGSLVFSSPDPLFAVIRDGRIFLAGSEIQLSGCTQPPRITLVDWRCSSGTQALEAAPCWTQEGNQWVVRLNGWQRLHWVEIEL